MTKYCLAYLASWALLARGKGRGLGELAVGAASEVQGVGRPVSVEVGVVGAL